MSWSLPGWSRQPGTFQLVLGYGDKPPAQTGAPPTALSDGALADEGGPKPDAEGKEDGGKNDAAAECKIRVQLEWGAGEDEEGVVLKLQSQLMMALPYPEEEVQVRMVPKSEAVLSSPEAPTPNSPEQSDMGLQSTSTNSAKTGSTIPAASSWGFLDRLAASIGRGANTESVPTSPVGAGGSPDEKEKLLVSGERNETDVNKGAGEHTADSEPAVSTAPESANALHGSRDEAHSDTETFEDAPHMFASGADSEPGALDTATASPTVRKPETPGAVSSDGKVPVRTVVKKRSERLRVVLVSRTAGTGPATEGLGVLNKIVEEGELPGVEHLALTEGLLGFWAQKEPETWRSLRTLNLSGCNLSVVPPSVAQLPCLEVLLLDHNKLVAPPADLGKLSALRKLSMDHNLLLSVPIELRQCTSLTELSLEHNRLVRPLLDFRAMARTLRTLRLFGNPLEFLPEILPCAGLRHLSLANVRIEGDAELGSVEVKVEEDAASPASYYFGGSKHRLSTFFQLIFRYSSCQHPLLASALARIAEDSENRAYIGRDEGAIRQLLSMVLSDDTHVVQQACKALSSIAMDTTLVARLVKADVLQSIWAVLGSKDPEIQVSVLQVLASVAFCSNSIAARLFTPDMLHRLKELCGSENTFKVREEALLVLGNLAFSPSNRRAMASAQGLRSLLAGVALNQPRTNHRLPSNSFKPVITDRPTEPNPSPNRPLNSKPSMELFEEKCPPEPNPSPALTTFNDFAGAPKMSSKSSAQKVRASAVRALAVMGENELVRKATGRRPLGSRGVKILSLDGGGMRGMATVRMLRRLEEGTGRRIHELFDLICGTSTGAMLAVALGVKEMSLDECEGIYKRLGKIVFAADDKDKEKDAAASFATWREKLDLLYKSGAQNLRVVIHGAKHDAAPFEALLKEMSAFEDGRNLLIETAGRGGPKVAVVSTLVSVTPAQPFVFRNYQYPPGTRESAPWAAPLTPLSPQVNPGSQPPGGGGFGGLSSTPAATPVQSRVGMGHGAYMGSCKHLVWQAIRASSAAPYYMDDFSDGNNRWQDGAVTANNPAIIAVREARLLWPDVPIDTLVSLGCTNLPTKPRGKNWKHVDTGSVLIESACSVERVEEALDTLTPLVPNLEYVRFNPVDESGAMELDETDPVLWAKLESATQDYIDLHHDQFAALCARLTSDLPSPSERQPTERESFGRELSGGEPSEREPSKREPSERESSKREPSESERGPTERQLSGRKVSKDFRDASEADAFLPSDEEVDEAPLLRLPVGMPRKEQNLGGGALREGERSADARSPSEENGAGGSSMPNREWAEAGNQASVVGDFSQVRSEGEQELVSSGSDSGGPHSRPDSASAGGGDVPGDEGAELYRGFSFSHSFAFGGPGGEILVEPRKEDGPAAAIDLNPNATWQLEGAPSGASERNKGGSEKTRPGDSEPARLDPDHPRTRDVPNEADTSAASTSGQGAAASESASAGFGASRRFAASTDALGLRRGLLFVEARPGPEASEGFRVWEDNASLLHHSSSHRPLVDAVCDQNKIARDVLDVCGASKPKPKPEKRAVLTRPVSSPSLLPASNLLTPSDPSPGIGLPRVSIKRESRDEEQLPAPEEALSFPARALYQRLQNGQSVGVVHLALIGDERGLALEWQSDVFAVAEPGEEARAFLEKLGGRRFASVAELCSHHQQFDVGTSVYTLVGRHTQVLPGGNEVGAFIFRRSVPSVYLTSEDVRHMVGAWRDRIVVSSRFALTKPITEALLDGGAKAVFELVPSDVETSRPESDGQNSASAKAADPKESGVNGLTKGVLHDAAAALMPSGWASPFTPAAGDAVASAAGESTSAFTPAAGDPNGRGSPEYDPASGFPEDSALEELMACFYSALYKEGLSVDQVDAAVRSFGSSVAGCRFVCHLPSD